MNLLNKNENLNQLVMPLGFMSVRSDGGDKNPLPFSSSGPFWFLDKPLAIDKSQALAMFYKPTLSREQIKKQILSERAQKAGSRPKTDALGELIAEIFKKDPEITEAKLYYALKREKDMGIICDINRQFIEFDNGAKIKRAKTSGLKHRLSRLRKKCRAIPDSATDVT